MYFKLGILTLAIGHRGLFSMLGGGNIRGTLGG